MKRLCVLIMLCCSPSIFASAFPTGDAKIGKQLFDKNNCNQCHNTIMGGDGNKIFQRIDRKVTSIPALIKQMHFCAGNIGIALNSQDEQNLGAYLNRFYNFK